MRNESWKEIYGQRMGWSGSMGSGLVTPRVHRPVCPDHCSGRHERDGAMACPQCQTVAFELWAHEYAWSDGHFFYERKPVNGYTLTSETHPTCRDCGHELKRRA